MPFGQCVWQISVVPYYCGHLLEEAMFGFISHAPEWHKRTKPVIKFIMVSTLMYVIVHLCTFV